MARSAKAATSARRSQSKDRAPKAAELRGAHPSGHPAARADAGPRSSSEPLRRYRQKRDFTKSPEPKGQHREEQGHRFVVQKHDARRLHYDLRLELDGVLKSWAITRGPSLVPGDKRLAVHTEDHPMEYLSFEGVIPAGEYGGGTMIVWDQGRWVPEGDPHKAYEKGRLTFELDGKRLKGRWHLVRTRPRPREKKEQWLLLKSEDAFARKPEDPDILGEQTTSVLSGLSNEQLAEAGEVRPDHRSRAEIARSRKTPGPDPSPIKGAKKGILPPFVEPCLATLVERAPTGEGWLHEIKFDGYRLQARIEGGRAKLLTRKGLDWTKRFGEIAEALEALQLGAALIDGEVVVEDEAGVSSFAALQQALSERRDHPMVFYVFDLLHLAGHDLRGASLIERKDLLQLALDDLPAGGSLRFSRHLTGAGEAMWRHACRIGLEGIVSKRAAAPYRSGRTEDWLKIKCVESEDFVIAGYKPSTTSKKAVGSLVLGVYEGENLVHVGRVGTGFTVETGRALWEQLDKIPAANPPFPGNLPREATQGVRWVSPDLVAEIEFRGWTQDGRVRHASFKGLREDKHPREATREDARAQSGRNAPTDLGGITLSHPDRVLWEGQGLTKQGLAEFYADIAGWILPHLVGRPLALVRCPTGAQKECFYAKNPWAGLNEAVRRIDLGGEVVLAIEDLSGLIALVQAGVLEIHPWGATLHEPDRPDRVTFDLDPGEGVGWPEVIEAAREVRDRLKEMGLESFVKTTGGKGLHVVVPLTPRAGWDEVKSFAEGLASAMAKDAPGRYSDTIAKRARTGRIFVDYLRNARGNTAVGAYSTRARDGAPVSTPVEWDELSPAIKANHYTVENLPARLSHLVEDPWREIAKVRQVIRKGRKGRP